MAIYCLSNFVRDPSADDRLMFIYNCGGVLTLSIDPYASTFFQKSRYVYIVTDGKMNYDNVLDFASDSEASSAVSRLNDVKKIFIDRTNSDLNACGHLVYWTSFAAHTGDTTIHFTAESLSNRYYSISGGTLYGDCVPDGDGTRDLGSTTNQWKDIWVSGGTIYLERIPLTTDGTKLLWNGSTIEGNPAGLHGEIQINSGDTFATSSNLSYNFDTNTLNSKNITVGTRSGSTGLYSSVFGNNCGADGNYTHAEGSNTRANGNCSHAEGYLSTASGRYSHVEGYNTTASGRYSHAEGSSTVVSGYYSHAEGSITLASGYYSHAEGSSTVASGNYSHAEGSGSIASGNYSHAESYNTTASGNYSHAGGSNTIAYGIYSHAGGFFTIASGDSSHSGGKGYNVNFTITASGIASFNYSTRDNNTPNVSGVTGNYSAILGGKNQTVTSISGAILGGSGNTVLHDRSIILGGYNITTNAVDTVYGINFKINNNLFVSGTTILNTLTLQSGSTVYGISTSTGLTENSDSYLATQSSIKAYVDAQIGSENYWTASGDTLTPESAYTNLLINNSITVGIRSGVTGQYSSVFGDTCVASGNYSSASGYHTTASGNYGSYSEGYLTIASGTYSHAEGASTISNGNGSHAEGYLTTASGDYTHAEGTLTISSGNCSHAGGSGFASYELIASGIASFNHSMREDSTPNVSGATGDYSAILAVE